MDQRRTAARMARVARRGSWGAGRGAGLAWAKHFRKLLKSTLGMAQR